MITEDYVSFKIAKMLKEKGFNEPCRAYWDNQPKLDMHTLFFSVEPIRNSKLVVNDVSCPTHQMAMKWLREIHGLSVETFSIKGTSNICPVFWKGNVVKLLTQDRVFSGELVGSYEEAVEAVLKYCLENLI